MNADPSRHDAEAILSAETKENTMAVVSTIFAPVFTNRQNASIFGIIPQSSLREIVNVLLKEIYERMIDGPIVLEVGECSKQRPVESCTIPS